MPFKVLDVDGKPYVQVHEFDTKTQKTIAKQYSPE